MNVRLPEDKIDPFNEIARSVVENDAPPWLADHFRRWTPSLFLDRHVENEQPTRAEIMDILLKVKAAALLLQRALDSAPVLEFLEASSLGLIAKRTGLLQALSDLAIRASQATNSTALSNEAGLAKAGRGKAMPPTAFSSLAYCAMLIAETWTYFHGREPPPRSRKAAAAASTLWLAARGGRKSWGSEPLNRWRHHFEQARKHSAEALRAEWRRHLIESEQQWNALHSAPFESN